jgi:o-succinylbenzoate synthase
VRIRYCPYHLESLEGKVRVGALLCFHFDEAKYGYADLHPWEERGDVPLDSQLTLLKKGIHTPLTNRSLYFAQLDAEARFNQRSLFYRMKKIPQHGYFFEKKTVKIKVRKENLEMVISLVNARPHIFRLDFNHFFTPKECEEILKRLNPSKVEFIEDPFPYDAMEWERLERVYGMAFALDEVPSKVSEKTKIVVVKPVCEDHTLFLEHQKVVVTSYLDHPLGQMAALYASYQFSEKQLMTCGIASHFAYQETPFSKELKMQEDYLIPPQGTGYGFDDLLKRQKWIHLL